MLAPTGVMSILFVAAQMPESTWLESLAELPLLASLGNLCPTGATSMPVQAAMLAPLGVTSGPFGAAGVLELPHLESLPGLPLLVPLDNLYPTGITSAPCVVASRHGRRRRWCIWSHETDWPCLGVCQVSGTVNHCRNEECEVVMDDHQVCAVRFLT